MNRLLDILKRPFVWFFSNLKITNNSRSKVLSVVFAIVFWLFVMDQENPEMSKWIVNIPVELKNEQMLLDDGLIIMDKTERLVEVEIKGRRSEVMDVQASDIHISANLLGYGKGNNSISLDKSISHENVMISDISQQEIKLFIDQIIEVPKPVKIDIIGKIKSGFIKDSMTLLPEVVIVKGPETYVNGVSLIKGELDVTELVDDTTKEVPVYAVDNDGKAVSNVTLGESYVDVAMSIKKVNSVKVLPNLMGEPAPGYKITSVSLEPNEVVLKGSQSVMNSIEALSTNSIDVSGITETVEMEVEMVVPDGTSIMYFEPPFNLLVEVEQVQEQQIELTTEDILIKEDNQFLEIDSATVVNELYTLSFGTEVSTIQLVIQDVPKVLSEISAEDIRVYVELSEYTAGTHTVPLYAEVVGKNMDVKIKPMNINVSLVEVSTVSEE
jgi:YbbR domain-containing protein